MLMWIQPGGSTPMISDTMEDAYGGTLEFQDMPNRKGTRIADYRANAAIADEQAWDDQLQWLLDRQVRLRRALAAPGGVPAEVDSHGK